MYLIYFYSMNKMNNKKKRVDLIIKKRTILHEKVKELINNRHKSITYKKMVVDTKISSGFISKVVKNDAVYDLSTWNLEVLFTYFTGSAISYIDNEEYNYRYIPPKRSRLFDTVTYLIENRPSYLNYGKIANNLNKHKNEFFNETINSYHISKLMSSNYYSRDIGSCILHCLFKALTGKDVEVKGKILHMNSKNYDEYHRMRTVAKIATI